MRDLPNSFKGLESNYQQSHESRRLADAVDGGHFTSTVAAQCTTNFAKVDYSSITGVCQGPAYERSSCCTAFNTLACKYKAQVNDFTSTCPIEFMSYLNRAGGYPDGIFVGRCNSNDKICSY
ncbi:hypothetical protein O6H91_02G064400 [Diphasiastrum complanatum]|uniref:Uncharacterized protein n=1 Tax=Diphasiastrum complanatum TaxID=34168 RepID=A0ACC2EGA3_DIPCM|nr:hypothetical protein O6H91_02G064400 [Diphasiastrum complanatum]